MRNKKILLYQLFPRLFGNTIPFKKTWGMPFENGCGKLEDINDIAIEGIKELHISHIWLTGIIRHATGNSYPEHNLHGSHPQITKGIAGSPYAIKDYYDIDPDLVNDIGSRMTVFEELVNRIHKHGIKVIIDFVPNHVSRDYKSEKKPDHIMDLGEDDDKSIRFSPNNNFYYMPGEYLKLPGEYGNKSFVEYPARATGNNVFNPNPTKNDWYETVKLNYGLDPENGTKYFNPIPDTWEKMLDILRFWSNKGIDGFRCDMAGMVPVEFWKYAIGKIKEEHRNIIFIAEIYEPENYKKFLQIANFDYLYDKVGLYDTTRDIIASHKTTDSITSVWQQLDGVDGNMLRFMENHDEQRIASESFAVDPLKGVPATALSAFLNTGPIMIYNGQEVGEDAKGVTGFSGDDGRTSIFDYCSMPEFQKWVNNGTYDGAGLREEQLYLRKSYSDLMSIASAAPELDGQFYDLMWQNQDLDEKIRNHIYAFLRYDDKTSMLIVVSFNREIKNFNVRIPSHAIDLTSLKGKERIGISYLYPTEILSNLMVSQLTGSGVKIKLDERCWCAVRLD